MIHYLKNRLGVVDFTIPWAFAKSATYYHFIIEVMYHCRQHFLFCKIQARPRPWGPCQPWRPWEECMQQKNKANGEICEKIREMFFPRSITIITVSTHNKFFRETRKGRLWGLHTFEISSTFCKTYYFSAVFLQRQKRIVKYYVKRFVKESH